MLRPLHLQVAIAVFGLAAVGLGMGAMHAAGERDRLKEQYEREKERRDRAAGGAKAAVSPRAPARDFEKEAAELSKRVRELEAAISPIEAEVGRLTAENERLERESGGAASRGSTPRAAPAPAPPGPPPAVAEDSIEPAPRGIPGGLARDPWGPSDESQLDDLAARLKLNPEQRAEVKKIVVEQKRAHGERIREIMAAAAQSGNPDPDRTHGEVQRATEAIWKQTQERIRQLLFPEQAAEYRKICEEWEEGHRTPVK
jgi:hypothetical protein